MPVIPSFGNFAQTPNAGSAYLGGFKSSVDIAQHAQQLQLERQKLAQAAQVANIEAQSRREIAQMAAMRAQQENEIQKSYQLSQIGLKERELQNTEQRMQIEAQEAARRDALQQQQNDILNNYHNAQIGVSERAQKGRDSVQQFKVDEAAKKSQAIMMAETEAERLFKNGGMSHQEAYSQAYREKGPAMGLGAGALGKLLEPPFSPVDFGGAGSVAGLPENYRQFQTGPRSRQLVNLPTEEDKNPVAKSPAGLDPNRWIQWGKQLVRLPDVVAPLRKELTALEKEKKEDGPANAEFIESQKPRYKATKTGAINLKRYVDQEARIAAKKAEIEQLKSRPSMGPTSTGTNAAPVKRFKYVNGKLVPQ